MGFDQHNNDLNYRVSQPGVATNPTEVEWSPDLFGSVLVRPLSATLKCFCSQTTQNYLPGTEDLDRSLIFVNITYPRFLSIPASAKANSGGADLVLELRVGRSGLGDDWLYKYIPNQGWTQIGRYLEVRWFSPVLQSLLNSTFLAQGVQSQCVDDVVTVLRTDPPARQRIHKRYRFRFPG